MIVLSNTDGPGLVRKSSTFATGTDIGYLCLGVDQNVLGSAVLAASGTIVKPAVPDDRSDDITVVANATNVCSVTVSGRAVTINLITQPNGFALTASTSADIETAINASGVIKVLTADATPSRTFAAAAIGAAQSLSASVKALGLASGDVALQVDDGTSVPLAGWGLDVPGMHSLWMIRPGVNSIIPWTSISSGTGSGNALATTDDAHPFSRQATTGSTTTGIAGAQHTGVVIFGSASHVFTAEGRFQVPVLSSNTDTANLTYGYTDLPTSIDAVDGAYVKLDSNTNTAFQCVTSSNSTRTTTSSGVIAVAGTWYRVRIVVTNDTKVEYYIYAEGGSFPATPTVTITTNIPTSSARATFLGFAVLKSAGTTPFVVNSHYTMAAHDRLAA